MSKKDVDDVAGMIKHLKLNSLPVDATAEVDTPEQLNVELMPHQRRAVKWMAKRENLPEFGQGVYSGQGHSCRGGILADDQGLGKTLSMLALILHNSDEGKPFRTLIVCPLSLVNQWKKEIETRIKRKYKKSVYLYHGANRTKHAYDLKEVDFVITTFQTLANEYPKIMRNDPRYEQSRLQGLPPPIRKAGAAFKLTWNRVILDEAHHIKNRSTDAWKAAAGLKSRIRWCLTGTPIQNSINDIFSLLMFIRYNFVKNVEDWNLNYKSCLESQNVKLRDKAFKKFQEILKFVLLRRTKNDKIDGKPLIILPEREVIVLKEHLEGEEVALYKALEEQTMIAFNKFLVAGTMSTNYTTILTLLLRLRQAVCHPFLIQYCDMQKGGEAAAGQSLRDIIQKGLGGDDCDSEETSEDEAPNSDDDDFIDDRSEDEIWNDRETNNEEVEVVLDEGESTKNRKAKRTTRTIIISDSEEDTSEDEVEVIENNHNTDFDDSDDDSLLALPLPTFVKKKEENILEPSKGAQHNGVSKVENEVVDLTGDEVLQENVVKDEEVQVIGVKMAKKKGRKEMAREMRDVVMTPSRKLTVLISKLKETRDEEPERKSLVFSQWTSCMDIISFHLDKEGIDYCRLDGSMTIAKRKKEIESFNSEAKKIVFLISLHAGGTGLNLTCASQVFLFDVWWNPSTEEQAIDRAHRIGQTRNVRVFRFRMLDTVEDRIYEVCAAKKETSDAALSGGASSGQKLSMEEIRKLFTVNTDKK